MQDHWISAVYASDAQNGTNLRELIAASFPNCHTFPPELPDLLHS
jgi:hypothetical protein